MLTPPSQPPWKSEGSTTSPTCLQETRGKDHSCGIPAFWEKEKESADLKIETLTDVALFNSAMDLLALVDPSTFANVHFHQRAEPAPAPIACLTSLLPIPLLGWPCLFSFLITNLPSPFPLSLNVSPPGAPYPRLFFLLSPFLSDSGSPLLLFAWFSKINICGAATVNQAL